VLVLAVVVAPEVVLAPVPVDEVGASTLVEWSNPQPPRKVVAASRRAAKPGVFFILQTCNGTHGFSVLVLETLDLWNDLGEQLYPLQDGGQR
jgi:hypothetical protein